MALLPLTLPGKIAGDHVSTLLGLFFFFFLQRLGGRHQHLRRGRGEVETIRDEAKKKKKKKKGECKSVVDRT
jgi:hypothetical protein